MTNNPKRPFNQATDRRKQSVQDQHEIEGNIRDKDNAAPRPKPPSIARYPAPNMAPIGAVGIKTTTNHSKEPAMPKQNKIPIEFTRGDPNEGGWIDGRIKNMEGYNFRAKVLDLPSQNGIEGGKIEKLLVRNGSYPVVFYDRGWGAKPETLKDWKTVDKIRDVFDRLDREFQPIAPKSPDKDHGHDR